MGPHAASFIIQYLPLIPRIRSPAPERQTARGMRRDYGIILGFPPPALRRKQAASIATDRAREPDRLSGTASRFRPAVNPPLLIIIEGDSRLRWKQAASIATDRAREPDRLSGTASRFRPAVNPPLLIIIEGDSRLRWKQAASIATDRALGCSNGHDGVTRSRIDSTGAAETGQMT